MFFLPSCHPQRHPAGTQEAAVPTYPVNDNILNLMNSNSNIVDEAKKELVKRWNVDSNPNDGVTDYRYGRNNLDSYTSNLNNDSFNGLVEGKVQEEIGKIKEQE